MLIKGSTLELEEDLLSVIVKHGSINYQSSNNLYKYHWIHVLPAIVKNDSVSHQSSNDPYRYR